jgi:hypothetical protein
METQTLKDELQSLVVKWHQLQLHYQDAADDNINNEHANRRLLERIINTIKFI